MKTKSKSKPRPCKVCGTIIVQASIQICDACRKKIDPTNLLLNSRQPGEARLERQLYRQLRASGVPTIKAKQQSRRAAAAIFRRSIPHDH